VRHPPRCPRPRQSAKLDASPVDFAIKPESLENVKKTSLATIPKFSIRGRLNKTNCSLNAPFTGEVTGLETATKIKSIELQHGRVETITPAGAAPGISDTRVTTSRAWPGGRPLKTTVRATL
jgi:hypothetical protein